MNEPLCPPTMTKQSGARRRVSFGEVDHLGDVGQVVEREADGLGPPLGELAAEVGVAEDLEVEEPHVVAGRAHRRATRSSPSGSSRRYSSEYISALG